MILVLSVAHSYGYLPGIKGIALRFSLFKRTKKYSVSMALPLIKVQDKGIAEGILNCDFLVLVNFLSALFVFILLRNSINP